MYSLPAATFPLSLSQFYIFSSQFLLLAPLTIFLFSFISSVPVLRQATQLFHVCNFFALYFLPPPPFPVCHGGEYQRKLYRDLMENYNRLERPVQNDSAPIVVELGLTLLQIIDVVSAYLCEAADRKIAECSGISPGQQIWLFWHYSCILFTSDLFSNYETNSDFHWVDCYANAAEAN